MDTKHYKLITDLCNLKYPYGTYGGYLKMKYTFIQEVKKMLESGMSYINVKEKLFESYKYKDKWEENIIKLLQ
jgi:hypothetical protein